MGIGHTFRPKHTADSKVYYACAACGHGLFSGAQEFDAGCGFPSFWQHLQGNVRQQVLTTYGRTRTQLLCHHCGAHLGHLFGHPHTPSNLRYCISAAAIVKK
ncbi:peptide-methionine (R)-S-oxide reductase [Pontibacter sp. CAU 1760]